MERLFGNRAEQNETHEQLPKPLYFVESSNDNTVLVAMDVKIAKNAQETIVSWFDTTKERAMVADDTRMVGETFAFKVAGSNDSFYRFSPMSLDIYNSEVKEKLINGRDFATEEELIAAFNETKRDVD